MMSIRKFCNIPYAAVLLSLMALNFSLAEKKSALKEDHPLFRLEINQICDTSREAVTIQLIGIEKPVFHEEHIRDDTVYLLIKDTEENRYRAPSQIDCPDDTFYIYVIFSEDTAQFMVEHNAINWYSISYRPRWFVELEPLKDLPADVTAAHLKIEQGKKNQYTIGGIIRPLNKQLHGRGELVYPDDGLYRCLPRVRHVKSGHCRWCETNDGIVIFVKITDSASKADIAYIDKLLDSLGNQVLY